MCVYLVMILYWIFFSVFNTTYCDKLEVHVIIFQVLCLDIYEKRAIGVVVYTYFCCGSGMLSWAHTSAI